MDTKPGTLYGVGVGPGDPELITIKGCRLLQSAPVVYIPVSTVSEASYARSIVEGYLDPTRQRIIELPFAMRAAPVAMAAQWEENARQIAAGLFQNQDAVFVTEGDPMLFSTFGHLATTLHALYPELPIQAVPGVSSITAAAAAAGIPLADRDERLAVLPATSASEHLRAALRDYDTVALLKVSAALDQTLDLLAEEGLTSSAALVTHCGRPEQQVVFDVASLRGQRIDYFSIILVRRQP